ncbi:MAG: LptF/LptG family permease [Armatimonadota bacterium]|nr:MAG: LptF/LptG family permease [Armatimonadota bacterium]
MKILDRYVARELLAPFVVGLVGFELLMLGNVLYLHWRLIRDAGAGWHIVARLLVLRAPEVAVYGIPFSMLLAASWAVTRLARDSEFTALRAGGASVRRILVPIIATATLVSGLAYLNAEHAVPWATHAAENIVRRMVLRQPAPFFRQDVFFRVPPNYYVYIHRLEPKTKRFHDILVYELTGSGYPLLTAARSGDWQGEILYLHDGVRHKLRADGSWEYEARFGRATINLHQAMADFWTEQKTPREMTAEELSRYIGVFAQSGVDVRGLELEYHFKFALPLAPLVFALLAAPLALRFARGGGMMGLAVAFVLAFLYQVLMSWSRLLGESGTLPPMVAAWSQNVMFGAAGIFFIVKQE